MRNIKKKVIITIITLIVVAIATVLILSKFKPEVVEKIESPVKKIEVPEEYSRADRNKNGVPDPIDISNNLEGTTKFKNKIYRCLLCRRISTRG